MGKYKQKMIAKNEHCTKIKTPLESKGATQPTSSHSKNDKTNMPW